MLHTYKRRKFEMLIENANRCNLCTRMYGRIRVLSEKNGNIHSRVIFIGEAPGRLGADRTGIPFYGDQAGKNFERLLQFAGLKREQVFITNAVLCNPRNEKGKNTAPTKKEILNCSIHLSILIDIIRPEFIVPLGRYALNSLNIIEAHNIELRQDVRKLVKWGNYTVIPMYHPSPRSVIFRNINEQKRDFSFLGEIIRLRG
ncbi:MAG: uracil-DNA glycosylase [Dehalococcoidales bacterium]